MADLDDLQSEEDVLTPADAGEQSASGSSPATTSDDDVGEMVEETLGEEPVPGKPFTLADQMEKAEKSRRSMPDKEEESQE